MKKTALLLAAIIVMGGCAKKVVSDTAGTAKEEKTNAGLLASPVGDVVGKLTVGYQGWFAAAGDGSPYNSWQHQNLESWPECSEYINTYAGSPFNQDGVVQPGYFGNLGNGRPAKLFSSYDQQVANIHCGWMQQNGIDCIALQRFGSAIVVGSVKKSAV